MQIKQRLHFTTLEAYSSQIEQAMKIEQAMQIKQRLHPTHLGSLFVKAFLKKGKS